MPKKNPSWMSALLNKRLFMIKRISTLFILTLWKISLYFSLKMFFFSFLRWWKKLKEMRKKILRNFLVVLLYPEPFGKFFRFPRSEQIEFCSFTRERETPSKSRVQKPSKTSFQLHVLEGSKKEKKKKTDFSWGWRRTWELWGKW